MPYVYMLRCADGTFYVGSTARDLPARVWEHEQGLGAAYTRRRRPVVLVWHDHYDRVEEAFLREKQVQGWSRAKREALIERRSDELARLAECRGTRRRRERREAGGS